MLYSQTSVRYLIALWALLTAGAALAEVQLSPSPPPVPPAKGMRYIRITEQPVNPVETATPPTPTAPVNPLSARSSIRVVPLSEVTSAIEVTEEAPPEQAPVYNGIELLGLNKVTARFSTLTGALGTVMRFGNLEIIAHRCIGSAPGQKPENTALLEIWELKPELGPQKIFQGWMFSSSPALSALEHPVYDISVSACKQLDLEAEEKEKEE